MTLGEVGFLPDRLDVEEEDAVELVEPDDSFLLCADRNRGLAVQVSDRADPGVCYVVLVLTVSSIS